MKCGFLLRLLQQYQVLLGNRCLTFLYRNMWPRYDVFLYRCLSDEQTEGQVVRAKQTIGKQSRGSPWKTKEQNGFLSPALISKLGVDKNVPESCSRVRRQLYSVRPPVTKGVCVCVVKYSAVKVFA